MSVGSSKENGASGHQKPGGSGSHHPCCLLDNGSRCSKPSGNASYNQRIGKTISQKKLNLSVDPSASHNYICDAHKMLIQSARKRKADDYSSDEDDDDDDDIVVAGSAGMTSHERKNVPRLVAYQLPIGALRRYKRHFNLKTGSASKVELAQVIQQHLDRTDVNEKESIAYFIYMLKSGVMKE